MTTWLGDTIIQAIDAGNLDADDKTRLQAKFIDSEHVVTLLLALDDLTLNQVTEVCSNERTRRHKVVRTKALQEWALLLASHGLTAATSGMENNLGTTARNGTFRYGDVVQVSGTATPTKYRNRKGYLTYATRWSRTRLNVVLANGEIKTFQDADLTVLVAAQRPGFP